MRIGVDLIEIARIEKILNLGSSLTGIFTIAEIETIKDFSNVRKAETLAGKFAVKEALSKALGTGISEGILLTDIETLNEDNGRPFITLYNKAKFKAEELNVVEYNVTISHTKDIAVAVVVLC